jgi:hypothetical protein
VLWGLIKNYETTQCNLEKFAHGTTRQKYPKNKNLECILRAPSIHNIVLMKGEGFYA